MSASAAERRLIVVEGSQQAQDEVPPAPDGYGPPVLIFPGLPPERIGQFSLERPEETVEPLRHAFEDSGSLAQIAGLRRPYVGPLDLSLGKGDVLLAADIDQAAALATSFIEDQRANGIDHVALAGYSYGGTVATGVAEKLGSDASPYKGTVSDVITVASGLAFAGELHTDSTRFVGFHGTNDEVLAGYELGYTMVGLATANRKLSTVHLAQHPQVEDHEVGPEGHLAYPRSQELHQGIAVVLRESRAWTPYSEAVPPLPRTRPPRIYRLQTPHPISA